MTVVVTGCMGQLGSELCRQLDAEAAGLDLPELDLTRPHQVLTLLTEMRPRAVINTAAYTHVDKAEADADRCRAVNADGVACLAEACRRMNCPLVQISTDYVFGGDTNRQAPYRETDPPHPLAVYGQTKLEGERHATSWEKHFVIRTSGLFGRLGPRSSGNFVETMLELAGRQKRLRVVCDQRSTPTYVPHLARAVLFLLRAADYGTYHVVNSGETTWHGLATELFRQVGIDAEIEPVGTAEYGAAARRPKYSVLDTTKYHNLPGRPEMPHWTVALAEHVATRERG
ncbi:MAG: dTDP-4-dehydrorhamnose reductase [Planctomycetota bacterium]|jgi:dTDP-4-dehydrorhamnose reductase